MAEPAANALLKTLEEPGEALLILITAAPEQLLATLRSRCQLVPFARLPPDDLRRVLANAPGAEAATLEELISAPHLLDLAAGSPGALLAHGRQWRELPAGLVERLLDPAADPLEALALARDLSEALDAEQQLWLLDWWQLALWRRRGRLGEARRIERLRRQLLGHVSPRLAWEVALLEIGGALRASGGGEAA
jgi:DNA polymerase-3 subunit delta'